MVRITATPEPYQIFNEFDRHGILLGLARLKREKNPAYKQRLLDVFVRRGGSSYKGLINAISRELGLTIENALTIVPLKDGDGNTLLTSPAIVFKGTKCYLYSDYGNDTVLMTIDRYEYNSGAFTLTDLVNMINGTGYFVATLTGLVPGSNRSMTIFEQASVVEVPVEELSGAGSKIVLANTNLIPGTVTVRSPNLIRQVNTELELVRAGDYVVKYKEGLLISRAAPAPGSFIKYSYRNDNFVVETSPVIIHNLQSDDFKQKMFEQVVGDNGQTANGSPTAMGADIINELMSVFPAGYGL